jgi:hypothetical protein
VECADSERPGPQGHAEHEAGPGGRPAGKRPAFTASDLRGRVFTEKWWHEAHTGIPVLANGIPNKLAEAVTRCTGNAVLPQVARVFARAIRMNLLRNR